MSESPQPRPPDPLGDDLREPSEQQIDDALSRASNLAKDLSVEIGPPETPPVNIGIDRPFDTDAELAEVDRLLTETKKELGVEPQGDSPPTAPAAPTELPDFMVEFTRPEPSPPPQTIDADSQPTARSSEVSSASGAVAIATPPEVTAQTVAAPHTIQPVQAQAVPCPAPTQGMLETVSRAAAKACEPGVFILEVLDRPISRLGSKIRNILGWVGLLLLAGAVVILMFART